MKALLVAYLLTQAAPPAPSPEACVPIEKVIKDSTNAGATVRPLRGEALGKEIDKFNNTPPETNIQFDTGLLVEVPNGTAVTFLGINNRVCTFFAYTRESWQRRRVELFGQPT